MMKPLDQTTDFNDDSEIGDGQDDRVAEIVSQYLAALDEGKRPDRREYLARYPELADRIAACLDSLSFVHVAGGQVRAAAASTHGADDLLAAVGNVRSGVGSDGPTRALGDFKLVREIARGGMGVVYEAIQLSLGRRVAVKVLPFAGALDSRHLQRFQNEAKAAAQLHHTNIVPVHAVGCERSVHFYAMQMIDGQSLADVLRELRTPVGSAPAGSSGTFSVSTPGGTLSMQRSARRSDFYRTVAKLGLQAAEALDYAHDQGIVHRDVKPGNLLLDAKGKLWVTDFGLAHAYVDGGLTQSGDVLGTLRYMSPEQASGRSVVLDQRTDVYSLGLTLYELVTLERALPGETREQLLREIGIVEPRSPRSIDPAIPPELETILLTAAAKDPADRYATAGAMADDLRRFLADEPIRARPPSLWDKSVKWTRRHRSLAMSFLFTLALLTIGSIISTILIAREQGKTRLAYIAERDRAIEANKQRTIADELRVKAEHNFSQARQAVDFLAHVAAEEMDRPDFASVRRPMLEASLAYYQSFLAEHKDDPSLAAQLDADRAKVSAILEQLAAFDTFFRTMFRLRILNDQPVRDDLKLTWEQIDAISEMSRPESFPKPGSPGGHPRDPARDGERLTALAADFEAKIARVLTSDQLIRLRQIFLQKRGAGALDEPEVAQELGITAKQKAKLRVVQNEYRESHRRAGWDANNHGPATSEAKESLLDKELAQLTAVQVKKWKGMIGAPFIEPPRERQFPGRGPNRDN